MPDRQILEIMQSILSIHPDASVEKAVQKIALQGTDTILIKQLEKNIDVAEVNVSTFMSKPILTLDANTSVKEARQKMVEINIRQYAVTQNGKIAGLISFKDLDLWT